MEQKKKSILNYCSLYFMRLMVKKDKLIRKNGENRNELRNFRFWINFSHVENVAYKKLCSSWESSLLSLPL